MASGSGNYFRRAQDAIESFAACTSVEDLTVAIRKAILPLGYTNFCFARPPSRQRQEMRDRKILMEWPKEWAREYHELALGPYDAIVDKCHHSMAPFRWSDVPLRTSQSKRVMEIAAEDYQLKAGYAVPIFGLTGYEVGLSFSGEEVDDSREANGALELIGIYAYNQLSKLRSEDKARSLNVTPRQREVLYWVAEGKTAWEISKILNVSQDTINKTISTTMKRLGVHTRAQAIAELLHREIDISRLSIPKAGNGDQ